jgi:hypothetical protein
MSLSKEILDPLALGAGESVIRHWKHHHGVCVLTNHRLVMLSPHHVLAHPHHEVVWNQSLQGIQLLEVMKTGDVAARTSLSQGAGSPFGASGNATRPYDRPSGVGRYMTSPSTMTGNANVTQISGDYGLQVDNVVVFSGGPDDAASIRDDIEQAAQARKKELGIPL